MAHFAGQEDEASHFAGDGVCRADGLVQLLGFDPVRRILEPRCVEKQNPVFLDVEAADGAEVAVAELVEHLPPKVANHLEALDALGRLESRVEQLEVAYVQVGRARVVVH